MSEKKCDGKLLVVEAREKLEEIKSEKHKHFENLNALVERIVAQFDSFLPRYTCKSKGSKVVHHPNAPGTQPISLEKEHKGRDHIPARFANIAIDGIEMLLDYLDGLFK